MPDAIEEALVRIIADTENFDESVRKGVEGAIRQARKIALDAFSDIENAAGSAGIKVASMLRPFRDQMQNARSSAGELAVALDNVRAELIELGTDGVRAVNRIEGAIKDLDNEIIAGPRDALRRLTSESDRFSQQIRASFGRAIAAGPEQLERSIEDLTSTAQAEFRNLSTSVRSSLGSLDDIPGLARLDENFTELTADIQRRFVNATADAKDELRELAAAGELTTERLSNAIVDLEQDLEVKLSGALKEVQDDLRRLSGDGRVFDEMAESIARAERETEQLQDALLALERSQHEEMASEFQRIAASIEHAEEEVEDFTRANRQAAAVVDDVGRRASVSYRQANSRLGGLIASLNRMRFVALDARFILSGIGIFAAAQFVKFGVEATSQIEQIRLSFQVMSRSIEGTSTAPFEEFSAQADAALESVLDYARETPYAVEEVADAVRKLSAYLPSFNLVPAEQIDTLNERLAVAQSLFTDIGGALAVLGQQDAMPRLVKALGDVAARGKLTGEEMRQFANALPGIEIRSAIITGIFDPSVQASESIQHLRDEFGKLGADAENAPTAALNAFQDLQFRGLITTDAVLQGLRATFRNLAGDDAIQKFTLTIAGSMEKVRESIQRGLYEGMEDLGEVMTSRLLPALEDVEAASQRFGESTTNLATAGIPLALDAFEELTEAAADVFDAIAEFAIDNRALIERGMESLTDAGVLLADILLDVLDATAPLVPAFLDLVVLGLQPVAEIVESLSPIIKDFSEVIDDIPTPLLAIAIASAQVNKALTGGRILQAAVAYETFGGAVGLAQAALSKFLPLAALTVGVGIISRLNDGAEAAKAFHEALQQEVEDMPGLEGVEESIQSTIDRLRELKAETPERSLGTDLAEIFNPFFLSANVNREQAIRDHKVALEEYQDTLDRIRSNTLPLARQALLDLGDGFDIAALQAALSDDVIVNLADRLGVDLYQSVSDVNRAFRDAIPAAGGLGGLLRDMGVDLPDVDFRNAITGADDLGEAYGNAATALQDLIDKQRAAVDPVFAVIDAQQGLIDANREYNDIISDTPGAEGAMFEAAEEQALAAEAAARGGIDAAREVIGAFGDLGRAVADGQTDADSFREQVQLISGMLSEEMAPAARALVEEGLQRIIDTNPELLAVFEEAGGSLELLIDGFVNGEQEIARTVPKYVGDWKDLAVAAERELQQVKFQEFVDRAQDAFSQLPSVLDGPLAQLASTILTGNAGLFSNFFEFGRLLAEQIQRGLDNTVLNAPRAYGYDNVLPSSTPSAPSPSSPTSSAGQRTASSTGGLEVNQYISTSDPTAAGAAATRSLSNELFLRGL